VHIGLLGFLGHLRIGYVVECMHLLWVEALRAGYFFSSLTSVGSGTLRLPRNPPFRSLCLPSSTPREFQLGNSVRELSSGPPLGNLKLGASGLPSLHRPRAPQFSLQSFKAWCLAFYLPASLPEPQPFTTFPDSKPWALHAALTVQGLFSQ